MAPVTVHVSRVGLPAEIGFGLAANVEITGTLVPVEPDDPVEPSDPLALPLASVEPDEPLAPVEPDVPAPVFVVASELESPVLAEPLVVPLELVEFDDSPPVDELDVTPLLDANPFEADVSDPLLGLAPSPGWQSKLPSLSGAQNDPTTQSASVLHAVRKHKLTSLKCLQVAPGGQSASTVQVDFVTQPENNETMAAVASARAHVPRVMNCAPLKTHRAYG